MHLFSTIFMELSNFCGLIVFNSVENGYTVYFQNIVILHMNNFEVDS